MEREMEEFRALQAEEKKVFLANLSDVEKKLKEKDRQADEVRCNHYHLVSLACYSLYVTAVCPLPFVYAIVLPRGCTMSLS